MSLDVARALALVQAEVRAGREASTGVVVTAPDDALVGRRLVRTEQGLEGTLGASALDAAVSRLLEGRVVGLQPMEGGIELYVERWAPRPELIVVGAGHIAQPLAAIGRLLDFRVLVLDDRPEFATPQRFPGTEVRVVDFADPFTDIDIGPRTHLVLVTRGHRHDYDCLRALARDGVEPAYVGMIGSRRRVRAAFEQLAGEGIGAEWLARIHAPLGLDIGSETPAEIAVAVVAEIVLAVRGGSGRPLTERADVLRHVRALSRTEAGEGT